MKRPHRTWADRRLAQRNHEKTIGKDRKARKGRKDGYCNRTACQLPLTGHGQWVIPRCEYGEARYYCSGCARWFNDDDRARGVAPRCIPASEYEQQEKVA